jgi:8-oxo-dGTP diphosphatase
VSAASPIHVVAGVLQRADGAVLVTQRRADSHLGGLWEFPGGKCEPGEDPIAALRRELREEIGVHVERARALWRVPWDYGEKQVLLDAYEVDAWRGEPDGLEGQAVRWLARDGLDAVSMPPADRPIVVALRLPRSMAITPEPGPDRARFLAAFERTVAAGVGLIQLRARTLARDALAELARACAAIARRHATLLLLNGHPEIVDALGLDGVHLPAADAARLDRRPLSRQGLFGASCHDRAELERAVAAGADYVCLAPVHATPTHPGSGSLGWERFAAIAALSPLPVFALGGLGRDDLATARAAGAFGVAAIRGYWREA